MHHKPPSPPSICSPAALNGLRETEKCCLSISTLISLLQMQIQQHTLACLLMDGPHRKQICSSETRAPRLILASVSLVDNLSGFLRGKSADFTHQNWFTHHGSYYSACGNCWIMFFRGSGGRFIKSERLSPGSPGHIAN